MLVWSKYKEVRRLLKGAITVNVFVGVNTIGRSMLWLCQISVKTAANRDNGAKLETHLKTYKVWETLSEITESWNIR